MSDPKDAGTETPPAETPMARALRMRKAAQASKPKHPGGGKSPRDNTAMPQGASKPWMKK